MFELSKPVFWEEQRITVNLSSAEPREWSKLVEDVEVSE